MSRSARTCSPCSEQGPVGLDAKSSPSIPRCPSQPGAGTGWDHRQSPQGTCSRRETQQTWTWTRADGEQSPANLSSARWPSHWPEREAGAVLAASNCSHSSLFLLNLSQRAPVFPSPQLHRAQRLWCLWRVGDHRALEYPLSISRTWQDIPDTRTQTQREETTPENKSVFNYIFFFLSLFSAFLGSCSPSLGQENKGKS